LHIIVDLGQALVIAELGTNRDVTKMENVMKNLTALMSKAHG